MDLSTGLDGLDEVLKGLLPGDNVVWQVETIEDYQPFVEPLCRQAIRDGRRCNYFRFARHQALVQERSGLDIHRLDPEEGFESFIMTIHQVIEQSGRGAYYIFDSLSDLALTWNSDRMLGNFFLLTCPYLFDMETITYFAVVRNLHSLQALQPISQTTQLFLDVYRHKGRIFVYPQKVQHRFSPTMHTMHAWDGDRFEPVMESTTISEIMSSMPWSGLAPQRQRLSIWDRAFLEAEEVWHEIQKGEGSPQVEKETSDHIARMIFSRDKRVLKLAEKYVNLHDLLDIQNRMIGTGLIGGKAVGMLLARAILRKENPRLAEGLEPHDSFFIGSDVFYTYLVENGCWWVRDKQRDPRNYLMGAVEARRRILMGKFPDYIREEFAHLLNYFGQSPIIVRSSSLLEDNFGNAFAGKYESVFCANQGPVEKRLEDFMAAVRAIYTSTMSEKALNYRAQRGLLQQDEQMALLVQRVSGSLYGHLFFPHVAGVGLSFNPYVWNEQIEPEAGMMRLVFGLGTRAVDRFDDDYTRVVALNAPQRRPEHNFDEIRQYAQRKIDVIDWESNRHMTRNFVNVLLHGQNLPIEMFASRAPGKSAAGEGGSDGQWVLTFDKLLTETPFVLDMREMLRTLQDAYEYPIEIEFAANFFDGEHYKINLLQCRPLQVYGGGARISKPEHIQSEDVALEAHGAVIGQSRLVTVDRVIYIVPAVYGKLPLNERYGVARRLGELFRLVSSREQKATLLLGPGRWGSTSPNLGVSVSFAEINKVSFLCEIVAMHETLAPEVSLGTHFFNELVEAEILYLALFPDHPGNRLDKRFFEEAPNKLTQLLPDMENWEHVIRVIDPTDLPGSPKFKLYADTFKQTVIGYLDRGGIES